MYTIDITEIPDYYKSIEEFYNLRKKQIDSFYNILLSELNESIHEHIIIRYVLHKEIPKFNSKTEGFKDLSNKGISYTLNGVEKKIFKSWGRLKSIYYEK